jgi:hypothetical protein
MRQQTLPNDTWICNQHNLSSIICYEKTYISTKHRDNTITVKHDFKDEQDTILKYEQDMTQSTRRSPMSSEAALAPVVESRGGPE